MKKISLLFAMFLAGTLTIMAQVSTIASGITNISGVVLDNNGNIYVSQRHPDNKVLKVNPSNGSTTVYCSVGLNDPTAMTIDSQGNIYVSNYTPNISSTLSKVVKIPAGGGNAVDYVTGIYSPYAIDIDENGNMYVGEYYSQRVFKVLPGGGAVGSSSVTQIIGNLGVTGTSGNNNRMYGLKLHNGVLYISIWNNKMYQFNLQTSALSVFSNITNCYGIAHNPVNDKLYVTRFYNSPEGVQEVNIDGSSTMVAGGNTSGYQDGSLNTAKFKWPSSIACDNTGKLYVADNGNSRLRLVNLGLSMSVTDINDKSKFNIYPNPTSSIVNIESNTTLSEIAIMDLSGKIIENVNVTPKKSKTAVDLTNYENGLYVIKVSDNLHNTQSFKVIKK